MMRRAVALTFGIALGTLGVCASAEITEKRYLADIKYLTSKNLRGRASGSPELDKAGHHLAEEFRKAGLRPLSPAGYLQPFAISVKAELGSENQLAYTLGSTRIDLKSGVDFLPLGLSGSGFVKGPLVFVGYGISAPEYGYDDYAGVDAKGKIAVVLRHEPQEYDGASIFEGRVYTEHAQLLSKGLNARAHGAIAVIYVNDTISHGSDNLEKFVGLPGPADPGIPFVQVASSYVEQWLLEDHRNFRSIQEDIDKTLKPQSFALPENLVVEIRADVRHSSRDVNNVIGYIPGATDEFIVIGAHYDHLGLGEQYSLSPEKAGTIHPGADDNASGVAGVLALARYFASQPRPPRGIVFMAFAGEELGLLGSSFFVNHPLLPLDRAKMMLNMDMIGRMKDDKVMIGGAVPGSEFRRILDTLGPKYHLDLDLSDTSVYGSSDHTSFKTKQIPTLFVFTGLHSDYHRPTDTWEKIEAPATVRLLHMIADFTSAIIAPTSKPQFASTLGN